MKTDKLILDPIYDNGKEEVVVANKTIRFDGTINTGHLLTIVAIIMCSIGAWYDVKTTVASQQLKIAENADQIDKNNKASVDRDTIIQAAISSNQKDNHQEIVELRTSMDKWFMRLDEKLDKKADKKGM